MTIKPNKKFAIISTIESEEEDEILKNIHADQTLMMNETSTNDFINAINSINASKYFVLSNDKNVVLAIEQAKTLIDKNIEIIKTTNMVEGYFALESLMLEDYDTLDAARVSKLLNEGMDATNAILFTKASKDSNINSVNVLNGDFIAINKGKIIAASKDLIDLVLKSISLVTDDLSQVSMFTGKSLDIDPYDILDKISDEFGADGVVIDTKDQKYVLMIGVC
jgi:dihydroxyacetone kinase-like predicted kinase